MSNFLPEVYNVPEASAGRCKPCNDDLMNESSFIATLFQHQITMKMYHLSCSRYGQHKSSDKYLKLWQDRYDRYLETWQGRYGRFIPFNFNIQVPAIDNNFNIERHIDNMISLIKNKVSYNSKGEIKENKEDLNVILMDMVLDLERLNYFLSFD